MPAGSFVIEAQRDNGSDDEDQHRKSSPAREEVAEPDHDARGQRQRFARTEQAKKDRLKLRNHHDHDYDDGDDCEQNYRGGVD